MEIPKGKNSPKLPPRQKGGGAAARQKQFEKERGHHLDAEHEAAIDDAEQVTDVDDAEQIADVDDAEQVIEVDDAEQIADIDDTEQVADIEEVKPDNAHETEADATPEKRRRPKQP